MTNQITRRQSLKNVTFGLVGLLLLSESAESRTAREIIKPEELYKIIYSVGETSNILNEHDLVALAQIESSLNIRAKSSVGARGLLQLTPIAWKQVNSGKNYLNHVYNPKENIRTGKKYLEYLHEFCEENNLEWKNLTQQKQKEIIFAAYNLGPHRLKHSGWKTEIVQDYIDKIQKTSGRLKRNNYVS